jgi:hypothetical protein
MSMKVPRRICVQEGKCVAYFTLMGSPLDALPNIWAWAWACHIMRLWNISCALEQALVELVITWRNNILSYSAKLVPRWNAPYQPHALSKQ